ncbi:hypothetical protein HYFRA_00003183 [Hymenoscyphus fraxineus]|uniref:Uncharacterized protein n=1 Tax=Hymenoscyphus fraxineus TaxID=746836 RepID=A0A9N9KUQ7_9HELO|nr:hypothetical protein HYFRA_00003183 [Hymenoscyphus fraxineus]
MTSALAPQIIFDNSQIRRFSTSASSIKSGRSRSSGQNSRRGSFVNADGEFDSDEEHPQDWSVETKEGDTWAARELRRQSIWAKIDHNSPLAEQPKEGRNGSILSLWQPGKDENGADILYHDDENAIDDGPLSPISRGSFNGGLSIPGSRRGTGNTQDRRPSILCLWSPGKDADGKPIIMHDDEEWQHDPKPEILEPIPEPPKPVTLEDATPEEKEELRKMLENMRKQAK